MRASLASLGYTGCTFEINMACWTLPPWRIRCGGGGGGGGGGVSRVAAVGGGGGGGGGGAVFTLAPPCCKAKLTLTVVTTSTGSPFTNVGLYCHCLTASTAALARSALVEVLPITRNEVGVPSFPIVASSETTP